MKARKTLALLALAFAGALESCRATDDIAGFKRPSGPARLVLSGSISSAAATQVALFAGYFTAPVNLNGITSIDDIPVDAIGNVLTAQIFNLPATGGISIPLSVELGPCLADPSVQSAGGCPVWVAAVLLSGNNTIPSDPTNFDPGANELDLDIVGPVMLTPGATVSAPRPLQLHEVAIIQVAAPTVSVQVGQTSTIQATPRDANGSTLSVPLTYASLNTSVASVNTAGVVTGVSVGSTAITVSAGGRTVSVPVTVTPPATIVLPADTTARFNTVQGSSTPTTLIFAVSSSAAASGFQIDLAAPQISYVGAAVGWLTASFNQTRTPATLSLTTANTAGLAAGTYTAVVSLAASTNGIPRRSVVATLTVSQSAVVGRVINAATGAGIAGASVSGPTGSTTSASDGTFTLGGVTAGATLSIAAGGFVSTQYFNAPSTSGTTTQIGSIPLAPTSVSSGSISGRIVDAVTGAGIVGATVSARSGVNATSTGAVAQVASGTNGAFTFTVAAGTYTLTATSTNYTTGSISLAAVGATALANQNIVLAPQGTGNTFRFVLTWGANPVDLDSHLTGPLATGGRFHVFYENESVSDANGVIAQLDIDAINGFGPETITLLRTISGTYRYYVHHYSGVSNIGSSGATVKVFRGSTQIAQFFPPAQSAGGGNDVWSVFTIDGTTLTVTSVNTIAIGVGYGGIQSLLPGPTVVRSATIDEIGLIRAAIAAHLKPGAPR